ncbi:MAG: hypothetical protein U1F43_17790 [Myxococcota bacterium]
MLERAPDHEEALAALIALAEGEGDVRRALPLYKRLLFAARSKDRTREAGLRLAQHSLERHEPEDARVLLRVVLEAAPDDLEAQLALAEVEAQEGHGQEAQRILEGALRQVPANAPTLAVRVILRLAHLLLESLADPAKARRVLWRAGDLANLEEAQYLELAELAVRAKEAVLALRFAGQVPTASPAWARAQAVRAKAMVARSDTRSALIAITEVLKREPDSSEALELLERCAPDPARRELLVHELHESARRVAPGPARARILHRVAVLYESLGLRYDAVEPLAQSVFECPEDQPAAEVRAARLMALQAEFGLWPDHQRTGALRLGWLPTRGDDKDGTVGVQTRIEVLVALGRAALSELADPFGARPFLEEATRLSPRHVEAHELLADALEDGGGGRGSASLADAAAGAALVQVLSRLESIRGDDDGKDLARIRLAEVQLDALGAPGQARATLGRVSPAWRIDARVIQLRQRAGLDLPPRPVPVSVPTPPAPAPPPTAATLAPAASPAPAPVATRESDFAVAVAAADAGDVAKARTLLKALLKAEPMFLPARELLGILPEDAPIETVEPTLAKKVDDSDQIEAGLMAATEHFLGGDLAGARSALERVLAVDHDVVPALELLAEVAKAQGDHRARAGALEKLVENVFDMRASASYLRELGDEREAMGDAAGARAARVRYLRLMPLDMATWHAHRESLEPAEQAEVLEARAEAFDDDGEPARAAGAWLEAAEAYLAALAPEAALALIARTHAESDDPTALEILVRAERMAGNEDRARAAAARLVPLLLDGPDKDELASLRRGWLESGDAPLLRRLVACMVATVAAGCSDDRPATTPAPSAPIVVVVPAAAAPDTTGDVDPRADALAELTRYLGALTGLTPRVETAADPAALGQSLHAGLVIVLDDAATGLDGDAFRLDVADDGAWTNALDGGVGATFATLGSATTLGRQYAVYELLRRLGARFFHPEAEWLPQVPAAQLRARARAPSALGPGPVYAPAFAHRSWTFHGAHPLEHLESFSDARFPIDEAEHVNRWIIKNRGDVMRGAGRGIAPAADQAQRAAELQALADRLGLRHGAGITLHNQQQGASADLHPDAPTPIRDQIDAFVKAIADAPGTPPYTFGIHFGPTELTTTPDQETVQWIDWAGESAHRWLPGVPVEINDHITGSQPTAHYDDLGCPSGTNELGQSDYYDLAFHAAAGLGVKVHTVMFYPLEGPAPVYGQTSFAHKLCLIAQAAAPDASASGADARARPIDWFPEGAYWLSFDNAVPVYLPLYLWTRKRDIELLGPYLAGRGGGVREHRMFDSGQEWGYWQQDYAVGLWAWNDQASLDDVLRELGDPLCPVDAWPASCAARDELVQVLDEVMLEQRASFLGKTDFRGRPGGLYWYFAGEDPGDELGAVSGLELRPVRVAFRDVVTLSDADATRFEVQDLAELARMDALYAAFAARLEAVRDAVPAAGRPWLDEVVDGLTIDHLRAAHTRALYAAALALRAHGDTAAPLAEAAAALALAETVIARREAGYRYPAAQEYGRGPNGTTYPSACTRRPTSSPTGRIARPRSRTSWPATTRPRRRSS